MEELGRWGYAHCHKYSHISLWWNIARRNGGKGEKKGGGRREGSEGKGGACRISFNTILRTFYLPLNVAPFCEVIIQGLEASIWFQVAKSHGSLTVYRRPRGDCSTEHAQFSVYMWVGLLHSQLRCAWRVHRVRSIGSHVQHSLQRQDSSSPTAAKYSQKAAKFPNFATD